MGKHRTVSHQRLPSECNLAVHGWPRLYPDGREITPCVGYIESDYAPGTFYPCADCNPNWERVTPETMRLLVAHRPNLPTDFHKETNEAE